jgi:replication-associated recombination protein RarA
MGKCDMAEKLYVEKYRPQTVDDCVLPRRLKSFFQSIVDKGEMQNLLLVGGAGCGKTTVAKAMCNEIGVDVLFINASENRKYRYAKDSD